MAGFKTHFTTAAVGGGIIATSLLAVGLVDTTVMLFCFGAAIIGGLLPDIDSDSSKMLAATFTALSLVMSFLIMFAQVEHLSILELFLLWLGLYMFFKLVVFELFVRMTVHRGIFHSIPAAFLALFATTIFFAPLLHQDHRLAWLIGSFMFMGFITHLLLDELTSLNLLGFGGVRQSFGTALKLYSPSIIATLAMYLATVGAYLATPETAMIFHDLTSTETWQRISSSFLPKESWFAVKFGLWRWLNF